MSAKILKGEPVAQKIRERVANEIQIRTAEGYKVPTLAVILVGDNPASHIYVKYKKIACQEVGINAKDYLLPNTTSHEELLSLIDRLNKDDEIDAILLQLPLPQQIDSAQILEAIDPHKDVDGFHPYNLGRLAQGRPYIRPCTPAGVMDLLAHTGEKLSGKTATVVGTSNIVGKPMIMELINAGVSVTCCNKKTRNIPQALEKADIIIVAAGCTELIKGSWLKPGCIVIDVGINRENDGSIRGDVEFSTAMDVASWITPVPGGVGPMTIASLLRNTLLINQNRHKR